MALYPAEALDEFREKSQEWLSRKERLTDAVVLRGYRSPKGREYSLHGVVRRLNSLEHALDRIFRIIPPDMDRSPLREELFDATAFIHSFFISVYGVLDNYARVFVSERGILTRNGNEIPKHEYGITAKHQFVFPNFSKGLQEYIGGCADWFEYQNDYRHAVAHRIPIYIPPKTLTAADGERWTFLEAEMLVAATAHDYQSYDTLYAEQAALGSFSPVISHSAFEQAGIVLLHGAVISDFATVVELGEKIYAEL